MRILIGCSAPPDRSGGGIITYATELAQSLKEHSDEIHFLSPTPYDRTWLDNWDIRHIPSNQGDQPVEAGNRLLRYIREQGIEGIINNDNPLLQSIAPAAPCPFVAIGHLERTSIASLACYRTEWIDYIVAISNDMQRTFIDRFHVPLAKCPIVLNGIRDPGHGRHDRRQQGDGLRLLYAGGFNRRKGADLILKAVQDLSNRWRGITLDWYGDMPQQIARRIAHLPHVQLHGRVPRKALIEALTRTDILLFPSRLEGCPMAMLEAMSLGVVPIASDGVGAMRSLITSGKEGYICFLRDWVNQMLDCVAHLRDNPNVLAGMRHAVSQRYLTEFQIERVADDLLRLLRQPTVDRSNIPEQISMLHWHRPLRPDGLKAPLLDRMRFRLGWLREDGMLNTNTATLDSIR